MPTIQTVKSDRLSRLISRGSLDSGEHEPDRHYQHPQEPDNVIQQVEIHLVRPSVESQIARVVLVMKFYEWTVLSR